MAMHGGAHQATDRRNIILIVDDNPENIALLVGLLRPTYDVLAATSGRRALHLAGGARRPDLILLDVMMPEMDGFTVMSHLRDNRQTQQIPVIFVTAMTSTVDEQRGLDLGAVDYITKPLRAPAVLARVHNHLELKRIRDRLNDHNIALEAEIARRMGENQLIQDVSIHALAHLAETRDPETGNHLRRTQGYVRALARHLVDHPRFRHFLNERVIDTLVKSAPLHDIGKVGIPDHILLKPGRLTPDEWEIMKTHAWIGSEAIEQAERDAEKRVEFLTLAKEIARWHHEKWDGSGYPDGLAGPAIPISARLMTLADAFDALINRRVYKEALPLDEARAIIVAERGRQFDPDVVDAFLALGDDFHDIAGRYSDSRLTD
jgi:putative two-component system response regulator